MVINDILDFFGKVDGEIILDYFFNLDKLDIYLNRKRLLTDEEELMILNIKEKYLKDYPIQYILGEWNFYGRDFYVEEGVLIPRFETEILIEKTLQERSYFNNILEIGIGTGIISITLALEVENANIIGADISKKAIELANKNKERYSIKNCSFVESDIYSNIRVKKHFDLIISNPPYISLEDMNNLHKKLSYEPENALYGGIDGMYFYKGIITNADKYLSDNGIIALEIGYNQKDMVGDLLKTSGFKNIKYFKDYNDFDRCIIARR